MSLSNVNDNYASGTQEVTGFGQGNIQHNIQGSVYQIKRLEPSSTAVGNPKFESPHTNSFAHNSFT